MPKPASSAIGVTPSSSAFSRLMTMSAAAPSEICDALPAVIAPSFENAGRSFAERLRRSSPGRTPSSSTTMTGSPLRWGTGTGDDLVGEAPFLHRGGGALVALRGHLVHAAHE